MPVPDPLLKKQLADAFTLIIPTYNRPEELKRLLRFLAREGLTARILICDSSQPENLEQNRATVAAERGGLDLEQVVFDPSVPVWVKLSKAADRVQTPYCSLCADDDFVIPAAIGEIVDRMRADPGVSLGHGWYFSFRETQGYFSITDMVYRGPSLADPDPVRRMYALASRYEALSYGIHRSDVMQRAFSRVGTLDSLLTKEIGTGMLTAIAGRVERYPILYLGRSLAPSVPYSGWHPLEMVADEPESLFGTYGRYREVIADALDEQTSGFSRPDLVALVDLAHLRYFSDFLGPPVLDYLFEQRLAYTPKPRIMAGIWPPLASVTAGARSGTSDRIGSLWSRIAVLAATLVRRQKGGNGSLSDLRVKATTANGAAREYIIHQNFLLSLRDLSKEHSSIQDFLSHLNNYVD